MNTFGRNIRLTTFGESHGPAMGGILDGMPSRVHIDIARIQDDLDRRAPGRMPNTSQRHEPDQVELLSGLSQEGITWGSPIGFIIRNGYSQLITGLSTVFPMEELEKGPKELKGFAAP